MRAVDSVRIFINDVVQQNVVYVSDVERKIRWPDDLPEGACGREIVVGDRGIVVVIARCAEYGEVERFQVVLIIVQVVIVFVPVLIPGQIAQGDPVYRNVVCAAAFR